jgi:hypothetical protein
MSEPAHYWTRFFCNICHGALLYIGLMTVVGIFDR